MTHDERVRLTAIELVHHLVEIERYEMDIEKKRKELQEKELYLQKLIREAMTREALLEKANSTR